MSLNIGGDNNGNIETHTVVKNFIMVNQNKNNSDPAKLLFVITIILLIVAPFVQLPYGFYIFLRLMVCASFGYLIWKTSQTWLQCLSVIIILLYNPIIPIHLSREIWLPINIFTALTLLTGRIIDKHIQKRQEQKIGFQ